MRISVTHSTVYRYEAPVSLEPHTFRFRPRADCAQRLIRHELEISPWPAGRTEFLDQDGNVVQQVWFTAPLGELSLRSSFEIETLRENPFDFLLSNGDHLLPPEYPEPLRGALAPYIADRNAAAAVKEFAKSAAINAGGETMPFLSALNQMVFDGFQQVIRPHGPPNPPEMTLSSRAGSCRDLAVLFCACCRTMGIAARFVSGYERQAAEQEQGDMHAWAEVYFAGGGWRGYDPSSGLAVANSHVAVAAAADPRLAAPVSGSYRGGAKSTMEFALSMQVND